MSNRGHLDIKSANCLDYTFSSDGWDVCFVEVFNKTCFVVEISISGCFVKVMGAFACQTCYVIGEEQMQNMF